ncbi:hypothetical protein MJA45_06780 [Paenibacillus aurantius]|uniref:Translation initiation factor IF-2 n=1 Tax=Paenibacillus aurantius TaxID=2918900 RepID=A0AA96RG63_9BACL|nr:hypothetical protein [Paenibacillus aurantius]WNQ12732.1 hypothetical protein MJA45_06780 [Paenibacillus aurantius]
MGIHRKWRKWGIGAGAVAATALMLNSVKAEPAFQEARQKAAAQGSVTEPAAGTDKVYEEWQAGRNSPGGAGGGATERRDGPAGRDGSGMTAGPRSGSLPGREAERGMERRGRGHGPGEEGAPGGQPGRGGPSADRSMGGARGQAADPRLNGGASGSQPNAAPRAQTRTRRS